VTSIHSHLPALQVIVPMLSAPLVVVLRDHRLSWMAATAASLCAFAIAIALASDIDQSGEVRYLMGSWPAPWGIELRIDAMSALLLLIVTGASSFALIAGATGLEKEIEHWRQPFFFTAWLLALAGLCGILVSADAFNIFVFMEISSLASYVLVAGGADRRALSAAFKYLVMGTLGATFYLIGVGLIYLMTGTLNLEDISIRIGEVAGLRPLFIAAGFITVGLALKAAVFPLHVWLPNAYTYAPHIVTVFFAACTTKVSLYILLRFDFVVFQPNLTGHDIQFAYFLMPLSLMAILVASAVAMFELNLKRLLAWSSVAQIGYIILGASLLSVAGVTASLLHIFNHALAKAALFLALTCMAMSIPRLRIDNIGGVARKMPWTMAAFLLAGLSLIGVPGTAGFISKWYLISASLEASYGVALVAIIVIGSLMSVAYLWRVIESAYFRQPVGNTEITEITEAPWVLLVPTWGVVLMNLYFGIFPALPLELSAAAAEMLSGYRP